MVRITTPAGSTAAPIARNYEWFVSLDLGSDSMAAWFLKTSDPRDEGPINLQEHARVIKGGDVAYTEYAPRLRTRIRLRNGVAPPGPLDESHADLELVSWNGNRAVQGAGCRNCLFDLFDDRDPAGNKTDPMHLPNPKIAFQYGADGVMPTAQSNGVGPVECPALVAMQHLITLVTRNLVLQSSVLRDADRNSIHLTISMPTTYSPEHVQLIRDFVQRHVSPVTVEVIRESHAVAYHFIAGHEPRTNRSEGYAGTSACFADIDSALGPANGDPTRIVVVDVGRGTTDLSVLEWSVDATGCRVCRTLAQTGRASGGNALTSILAAYFEARVQTVRTSRPDLFDNDNGFSFLTVPTGAVPTDSQCRAVDALAAYIEEVKRSLDEELRLDGKPGGLPTARQRDLAGRVASFIVSFDTIYRNVSGATGPVPDPDEAKEVLCRALQLPVGVPLDSIPDAGALAIRNLWRRVFSGLRLQRQPRAPDPDELTPEEKADRALPLRDTCELIRQYVETNVRMQFENTEAQIEQTTGERDIFRGRCALIVAGQAAQFAPLREAILHFCCRRGLNKRCIRFLSGADAKLACAAGAIAAMTTPHELDKPWFIHGTYGITPPPGIGGDFVRISTEELNGDGHTTIVAVPARDYVHLMYTPLHISAGAPPPDRDDDTVVFCADLPVPTQSYTIVYDTAQMVLVVTSDNGTTKHVRLATLGQERALDIWDKVWPERLRSV